MDRPEIDDVLKEPNPFRRGPALQQTACRLFVILAREAATGVIMRRGPTEWVQLIKWNTATDTFEAGQWFHGRIYEQRTDLSPDGTKLIYFAHKMPGRPAQGIDSFYAWTAISKPPYVTALALWPSRLGTWFGGGLFDTNTHIWLNHPGFSANAHPDHQPPPELKVSPHALDPRYPAGYYYLLHRDGWQIDQEWWQQWEPTAFVGAPRAWHEKTHPRHAFKLVMESDVFNSPEAPTCALQDNRRGELIPIEGATWADLDRRGRLVYGKDGKLFAVEINEQSVGEPQELADFNSHRPEPVEAPGWAKAW